MTKKMVFVDEYGLRYKAIVKYKSGNYGSIKVYRSNDGIFFDYNFYKIGGRKIRTDEIDKESLKSIIFSYIELYHETGKGRWEIMEVLDRQDEENY